MSAYVISELEVLDPVGIETYRTLAAKSIAHYGRRSLVRVGAGPPSDLCRGRGAGLKTGFELRFRAARFGRAACGDRWSHLILNSLARSPAALSAASADEPSPAPCRGETWQCTRRFVRATVWGSRDPWALPTELARCWKRRGCPGQPPGRMGGKGAGCP